MDLLQEESDQPVSADDLLAEPPPVTVDDLLSESSDQSFIGRMDQWNESINQQGEANRFDPKDYFVGEAVDAGGTGFTESVQKKLAADEWGQFKGIQRILNLFSIPQDAVGRGLAKALVASGSMPDEDAKRLLSQEHVSPSDFINYYMDLPDSLGGKVVHKGLGFAADMIVDPIGMLSLWGKTKKGMNAFVGGKNIDLSLLSEAEKMKIRQAEELSKVVTLADDAPEITKDVLAESRKVPGVFSADDILNSYKAQATPEQTAAAIRSASEQGKFVKELAAGDRGISFGIQIPFVTAYHGYSPEFLRRMTTMPLGRMMDNFGNWLDDSTFVDKLTNNKVWNGLSRQIRAFRSQTGDAIYDSEKQLVNGTAQLKNSNVDAFEKEFSTRLSKEDPGVIYALRDELELGDIRNPEALLDKYKKSPEELAQIQRTPEDAKRLEWLQTNPNAVEFLDAQKQINDHFVQAYKDRPDIPFEELNPFGEGWARTYLRHKHTNEYVSEYLKLADQEKYIYDTLKETKKYDASLEGRKYRGTINEANWNKIIKDTQITDAQEKIAKAAEGSYTEKARAMEEAVKNGAIKMFIDDPVKLVAMRAREMNRTIRNHDLMKAAEKTSIVLNKGSDIPQGYVLFNLDDFKDYVLESGKTITGDKVYNTIIPGFFKENKYVAVPEMVYDDLLYNTASKPQSGVLTFFDKVFSGISKATSNIFLAGIPYQARNILTNASTAAIANVRPTAIAEAVGMFTPFYRANGKMKFKSPGGTPYELLKSDVWDIAVQRQIVGSGLASDITNISMSDAIKEGWRDRSKAGFAIKKGLDILTLWGPNRVFAQYADDVPKLAMFIDRMEKGFSPDAAAEAVHKYYYNYQDALKTFQRSRQYGGVFLSYPVKTTERFLSELKNSELGNIAIPYKVNQVLQGAFVEEPEVRDQLDQLLPGFYKHGFDKIHGPLLPGGNEVLMEFPWAYNAMAAVFNPEQNVHPVLQLLASWIASNGQEDLANSIDPAAPGALEQWRKQNWRAILKAVPPWLREGLAVAEINGVFDMDGEATTNFSERFAQYPQPVSKGNIDPVMEAQKNRQFYNTLGFGEWLEKNAGDNFIYRMMFPERIDLEDENLLSQKMTRLTQRANYIRQHFSDLTFGIATLSNMDRQFLLYNSAINRRIKDHTRTFEQDLTKMGIMFSPDLIDNDQYMDKWQKENPNAAAIQALTKKQAFLTSYYNWYLGVEKNYPRANAWNLLFGIDQYKYEKDDIPSYTELQQSFKEEDLTSDEDVNLLLQEQNPGGN